MVIRVPKLIHTALSLCERPYSLLGFGDILLPGIFYDNLWFFCLQGISKVAWEGRLREHCHVTRFENFHWLVCDNMILCDACSNFFVPKDFFP